MVANDYRTADIPKEDKIMLMYVEKLTKESYRITKNDIEKLRKANFSDREIFDIN